MFFSENDIALDLLGVFKLERQEISSKPSLERNYDSISVRINGRGFFETDNRKLSVKKGDLLYIPKNAQYNQSNSRETVIAIHFINYTYNSKNSKIEKLTVDDVELVNSLVEEIYDVWKEKKQGYKYKCTALLYELLYYSNCLRYERETDAPGHDLRIKDAVDYIHCNFRSEQIEISFLADMAMVSEAYFRKLFKKIYRVSPKQYIINLRLETATQLLESKLYSVTEVSERSGFSDPKYFCKLFKNRYGCSPKRFTRNRTIV